MAAPTSGPYGTTATIYDPAGVDTNPIADGWTTDFSQTSGTPPMHSDYKRLSNFIVAAGNGTLSAAQAYRPSTSLGMDTEIWGELHVKGADATYFAPTMMIADVNLATRDFYQIEMGALAGTDTWSIYQIFNAVGTLVSTATREFASTDYWGMAITNPGGVGNPKIEGWHWPIAGSVWNLAVTFTDSTPSKITTAGFIGLESTKTATWSCGKIFGGAIGAVGGGGGTHKLGLLGAG